MKKITVTCSINVELHLADGVSTEDAVHDLECEFLLDPELGKVYDMNLIDIDYDPSK